MAAPCYNGPNPVKDDERIAIWKWAKANGIDQGLPIEKVHDAINQQFFAGHGKPEWINDILSGRKTPFKYAADDVWKAQSNRRLITQQAANLSKQAGMGPIAKFLGNTWNAPRAIEVAGHNIVFPVSHGGDLLFRPSSWGTFFHGISDVYTKSWFKGATARVLDYTERQPRYRMSIESGLDFGPKSQAQGIISHKSGPANRAWQLLGVMRFELWDKQMDRMTNPSMSTAEMLEVGKKLADWANHATGSAKTSMPGGGNVWFGPKLTVSRLSRIFSDPVETAKTFANWDKASVGDKAVAWTRLSGAMQYFGTGLGFLAANWGVNKAQGVKDQDNVNFTDPSKSNWMQFKVAGLNIGIPGLHTEIKTIGNILGTAFASSKQLRGESREGHLKDIVGGYLTNKLSPVIGLGIETVYGQNWKGQPVPWSSDAGKGGRTRMSWIEYAAEHGPIPLQGPIGYVYDHLKKGGASAMDALTITRGLILSGLGAMGLHVKEVPEPTVKPPRAPRRNSKGL